MKKIIILPIIIGLLLACSTGNKNNSTMSDERIRMEEEGVKCLNEARDFLHKKEFQKAEEMIVNMRNDFPMAITARKNGILLMDSIKMLAAEHEMFTIGEEMKKHPQFADSLQVIWEEAQRRNKFYKRKLEHDHHEGNQQ